MFKLKELDVASLETRHLRRKLSSIGFLPAFVALTLYSVLPVLRNTVTGILDVDFLVYQLARVEAGRAGAESLDDYQVACRPAAEANANASFGNLRRLGEVSKVLGSWGDLAGLEARLDALSEEETVQLARAIERPRSHFLSDGEVPRDPRA